MVKHVIIWKLRDELDAVEKKAAAARMKEELEALKDVIDGIIDIRVVTDLLESSAGDVMLDSLFKDAEALAVYADHPAHVRVKEYVRTVVSSRSCADYEI